MPENPIVTAEARTAIAEIAQRYNLSQEAVLSMLYALRAGGGTMAQFSIPELGGSGQWMRGGMTMVGDMFDNALKARVDALCGELVQLQGNTKVFPERASMSQQAGFGAGFGSAGWWPEELGVPSSTGGQNDARYAIFPGSRRLAIQINGATRIFDTGDHQIGGVQQQQGSGPGGTLSFTSQFGTFDVSSLTELGRHGAAPTAAPEPAPTAPTAAPEPAPTAPTAAPEPAPTAPPEPAPTAPSQHSAPQTSAPKPGSSAASDATAIIAAIESLAGLHERGILSEEEFVAKKADLLGRL